MKLPDRALLIAGIVLLAVLVAAALFWRRDSRRAAAPPPAPTAEEASAPGTPALSRAPAEIPEENQREVTLFFRSAGGEELRGEKRKIFLAGTIAEQARQAVEGLIEGPLGDLLPTLPPESEVREVYLVADGTAYVDFSQAFVDGHIGGSSGEIDTVFSLVDTLAFNFPEIQRVKILVEGEERATLKEHLDLSRSFLPDMSLVAQGEER